MPNSPFATRARCIVYLSMFRSRRELLSACLMQLRFALFPPGQGRGAETVLVHGATAGLVQLRQLHEQPDLLLLERRHEEGGKRSSRTCPLCARSHDPTYLDQVGKLPKEGGRCDHRMLSTSISARIQSACQVWTSRCRGSRDRSKSTARNYGRDATILGMSVSNASPSEFASIHRNRRWLENRSLRPVVGKEMPRNAAKHIRS